MHAEQFEIDSQLVATLLKQQCPEFAKFPIRRIKHVGTDNAIFRLGDQYAIRLPRINTAIKQIIIEQNWLAKLSKRLPFAIPVPVKIGQASAAFASTWYIYRWLDGHHPDVNDGDDLQLLASDLATFIASLWQVPTDGAPVAIRGLPLMTKDKIVSTALLSLKSIVDTDSLAAIWQLSLTVPDWCQAPVWLHGDLLPFNLIVQHHHLRAVIDFGLMGVGDPACDLLPAWCLFNAESRKIFKEQLAVDDATWLRAKAWAIAIALPIIPYYRHSNPALVAVAMRMIDELLLPT